MRRVRNKGGKEHGRDERQEKQEIRHRWREKLASAAHLEMKDIKTEEG